MSEHQRCYRCGNLAPWCHCGKVSNLPQGPPPKTRYEKQRDAIVAMETTEFSYSGIGASDYDSAPLHITTDRDA